MDLLQEFRFRRLKWELDAIHDSLDKYLDFIYAGIQVEQSKHKEFLEGLRSKPEFEVEIQIFYGDETRNIETEFPRRAYSSFVVTWFSTFEETLLSICKYFGLKLSIGPFDPIDNVRGINRAKSILQQSLGYELNKSDWDELNLIRQIRNNLVHKSGEFRPVFKNESIDLNRVHLVKGAIDGVDVYVEMPAPLWKYVDFYYLLKYDPPRFRLHPSYQFCKHLIRFQTKSINLIVNDIETQSTKAAK